MLLDPLHKAFHLECVNKMSTRPERPKATKVHPDFKPAQNTDLFDKAPPVVRKMSDTKSYRNIGVKNKEPKPGNDTRSQPENEGQTRTRPKNNVPSRDTSNDNKEVTQTRQSDLPKGFVRRKDLISTINTRENEKRIEIGTLKVDSLQDKKQDLTAKKNARKDENKLENDMPKANPPKKETSGSVIGSRHVGNIQMQKNDTAIQKVKEMSTFKPGFVVTKQIHKTQKEHQQAAKKDSHITLEKSRTYRVPTRDSSDSKGPTKPDSKALATEDITRVKGVKRKQLLSSERDVNETRLQSVASGASTTEKRIPSAKTLHSFRSSASKVMSKKEQLPPNELKITILNTSGKNDKSGAHADRRKHVIQTVIIKESPDILLFQEFRWVGITGKTWVNYPIPEHYTYKGHTEASIMYDRNVIEVQDIPGTEIDTLLGGLQNNASNRLKKRFPLDFAPVSRMCMTQVTSSKSSAINFIVISWHGCNNESGGGRMKEPRKVEYFEYLMEFLRQMKEKYKLPIIIAGDFKVDMHSIEKCVQPPFRLCMYDASMRRTVNGIVDFFIVTEEVEASNIKWFDIERDTKVFHPTEILDHDPVSTVVRFSPIAKGKPKFTNQNAWISPKSKAKAI